MRALGIFCGTDAVVKEEKVEGEERQVGEKFGDANMWRNARGRQEGRQREARRVGNHGTTGIADITGPWDPSRT